tara:strand:+ start:724 stop:867 length:144 start_codon:yes stop_codon:yes gene_type:complete
MAYIPLNQLQQVPEKKDSYAEFSMFGELPAWGCMFVMPKTWLLRIFF